MRGQTSVTFNQSGVDRRTDFAKNTKYRKTGFIGKDNKFVADDEEEEEEEDDEDGEKEAGDKDDTDADADADGDGEGEDGKRVQINATEATEILPGTKDEDVHDKNNNNSNSNHVGVGGSPRGSNASKGTAGTSERRGSKSCLKNAAEGVPSVSPKYGVPGARRNSQGEQISD